MLVFRVLLAVCISAVWPSRLCAQEAPEAGAGKLRFVDSVSRETLAAATSVVVSPDGRFVYVAAEGSAKVTIYRREVGRDE